MTNAETEAAGRPEIESLLARLRRIEGQIRGIHRMLEQDRVCEDIVTQLMAARSSLEGVGLLIIQEHIDRCLLAQDQAPEDALRNLQAAVKTWMRFGASAPAAE
jgi:DNA-binding FrmR family transcriptional regulator